MKRTWLNKHIQMKQNRVGNKTERETSNLIIKCQNKSNNQMLSLVAAGVVPGSGRGFPSFSFLPSFWSEQRKCKNKLWFYLNEI